MEAPMPLNKLTDKARAFLAEKRFAVLSTINRDGTPQLTTMWYELEDDEILMNTADGRVKAHNLRRDPRIAICVEDGYSYVTLSGTARLNDDQAVAQADIQRLAARYHTPAKADQMMRDTFSKQHRITVRMAIERVVEDL
jgi:PPOX class probable F420-dependent enzyme